MVILGTAFLVFISNTVLRYEGDICLLEIFQWSFERLTVIFYCDIVNQTLESAIQTGSINFRPKRQQL